MIETDKKKSWFWREWEYEKELERIQNLPKNREFNILSDEDRIKQLRKGDVVYCTVDYVPVTKIFGKKIPSIFAVGHIVKQVKGNTIKVLESTPISKGKKAIWVKKECIAQVANRGIF